MSTTPLISVIIPIYYCDLSLFLPIQSCITAIQENYPDFELILVDDCSPLPVNNWPITSYNEENRGFTATVNKGLAKATGDVLIALNDDITVKKGQLDRFIDLRDMEIASPADTSSSPDDKFGACWGMTARTYRFLGPLDEQYRNFYSDLEYYQRAKKEGVEIIKWYDIVLEHPESSTYKLLDKEVLLNDDAKRYHENR